MTGPSEPVAVTSALTIPAAFAEQVLRHGAQPAVVDGDVVLTYRELDERSRQIAGVLRGAPLPASLVAAVLAAHGAGLIVALLGALRAGMAVVILDPDDPARRLRELLTETEAAVLLADAAHASVAAEITARETRVVRLDEVHEAHRPHGVEAAPAHLADEAPAPGDTAFVLFTSGSTGKPKGVVATHANMVRHARSYALSAGLQPDDRLTLLARPHFMAGLSAIFGALLNGAAILPFDVRARGFRDLRDWLLRERLTVYHSVPTLFRRFCESLAPDDRFPSIRIFKLGGEPVMRHDLKLWRRHGSGSSVLINGLGLSEANGNLCHFKLRHDEAFNDDVVPVGRPLPGVDIVLLDEAGAVVPAGDTGEIAFRCAHRSPGYWRSDDFAARLVRLPDPHGGEPFFRTGDLGRFRADGCLVHLGRKDDLIKLRGLRIEPAQVEAALLEDPRILHCAVGVCGEGSRPQQLVAWFVPASGEVPAAEALRASLARRLPPALIPTSFVTLAELPMTPGGKVDRKALPDPRLRGARLAATGKAPVSREAPRDAIELTLLRMWRKQLHVGHVAPQDDFFALGGDSLTAAVMLSHVEKALGADVAFGAFLADPTPGGLAALVRCFSADPTRRPLALVRRGGDGTPYFYVPGAGAVGRPPAYDAPAGPRAHYCLNYRGIDGVEAPQRSIPEMAAYFLEQVRQVQPFGPYLLGGGSFGALVALEAAHRLLDEGESVSLLVVEDALLDGCLTPRPGGRWSDRLERSLLWLVPVGKRFRLTWPGVREGLRQWRYRLLVPFARWRSNRREKPLPKVYRFHDLLNHSLRAKRDHVLRPYPGPTVLIRTRFAAARRLFDVEPTLGWSRVCSRLSILEIEGEKAEHLNDPAPYAAYLAKLDALLEAADDGSAKERHDDPALPHHT